MVDYLKAEVYGCNSQEWTNNPYLDFKGTHSTKTGLIDNKITAQYNSLTFTIYDSGLLLLSGSIHKYFNHLQKKKAPNQYSKEEIQKGFNGNDFNLTQLKYALNDLKKKFNIDLNNSIIRNIEFGVNLIHLYTTDKILDSLMLHKGRQFYKPLSTSYSELQHTQYWLKCYNKATQYGLNNNLIRFEIKYKKMKQVNDLGIINLSNLTDIELMKNAKAELLKRWKEILFIDYTISENKLTSNQKTRLMNFKNPLFWKGIKSNHLHRPKKQYHKIEAEHSEHLKKKFSNLISTKWEHLNKHCVTFDRLFKEELINV